MNEKPGIFESYWELLPWALGCIVILVLVIGIIGAFLA